MRKRTYLAANEREKTRIWEKPKSTQRNRGNREIQREEGAKRLEKTKAKAKPKAKAEEAREDKSAGEFEK